MLFFRDTYDLNKNKTIYFVNQRPQFTKQKGMISKLTLLWQPSRFNMAAKSNLNANNF